MNIKKMRYDISNKQELNIFSDLAGVVILYNPQKEVKENILSYLKYLSKLYIIDNSERINVSLINDLQKYTNIEYFKNDENMGISYSLNKALHEIQGKFKWLLTMDQDTSFKMGTFTDYVSIISNLGEQKEIIYGVCPKRDDKLVKSNTLVSKVEKCITSGNIINVSIALQCGGFDEALFIDEVDHEFCYRCNRKGFILLQYNKNILNHELGHPIFIHVFGKTFQSVNENYIRAYYITRNHLYIVSKYPHKKWTYYNELFKFIIKIILFEPNKNKKLLYVVYGIQDYYKKKMGKIRRDCKK